MFSLISLISLVVSVGGFVTPASKHARLRIARPLESSESVAKLPEEGPWKAAIVGITVCWGGNFAVIKHAMGALSDQSEAAAALLVATRFVVASIALLPFLVGARKEVLSTGFRIGLWCALGYAAQAYALHAGAMASTTAFECSLQSVVVAAWSIFAGSGGDCRRPLAAVALAVAGVGMLTLSPDVHLSGWGEVVALGQAVGFGASYVELGAVMDEEPDAALPLAAAQCVAIAAVSVVAAGFATDWHLLETPFWGEAIHSPSTLASIAWLSVVSTAFTIWLQAVAFKQVSPSDASIILTSEPLWAALFAFALLGETFTFTQALGGAAIFGACALNDGLLDDALPTKQGPS
ncbi:hypothetical protein CTAYLR_005907 [Chrysophaeum taylorii]|uniref:EamA domain-containing protein n=1 Tax=Chrysophaeum taylorii TaxID=2483200 RepID=A0AAD7UHD9_9STRA|nr:hypothetical protein CTAYLR_005881 [Chrysophaeum taylorii]KAJ8614331.1 hypothetical protein CTAYLR_005907 [Chrysophaeum taylorii]